MHGPRCKRGWHSTGVSTPPQPDLVEPEANARALARTERNWAVSVLHRPPTSAAQHDQSGPSTIARQVRVGPLLAASCDILLAVPSRCNGETMVVSMASWAPRNKVNPSATTSNLLPSKTLKAARSKYEDVCGHASSSLLHI